MVCFGPHIYVLDVFEIVKVIIIPISWESYDEYDSMSDLGEIRVYQRADFQSGSRVLKKVF